MTKEQLYNSFNDCETFEKITEYLDEFFKDKVIIQRGENRHEFSDVLHSYFENTNLSLQYFEEGQWFNTQMKELQFRIKPCEPLFEYQWVSNANGFEVRTAHVTDEEFENSKLQYDYWGKDIKTKRERK